MTDTYEGKAEQALAMLEGSPYIHLLLDSELRVLDCNQAAAVFFGASSPGALKQNFRLPEVLRKYANKAMTGEETRFETEFFAQNIRRAIDGSLRRVPFQDGFALSACFFDRTEDQSRNAALVRQSDLLQSINDIAIALMRARPEEFDLAVWESLRALGRVVLVDRVYIWQNFEEDGVRYCRQTHEWSEGAEPQQGKDFAEFLPYDEVPVWRDCVFTGTPMNSPVCDLPESERLVLEPQGIKSILVIPVMVEGEAWGFIGFDDCREVRFFSKSEELVLVSGGTYIVSAIIRNKMTDDLQEQIIAARKASEANEMKSNFLARTSHEIRTPMNAIIGMAELALRETISPQVRAQIADIKNAGGALLTIINDILDFSKIESGKMEIVAVEYRLSSLLEEVITIIRMRSGKKGLAFLAEIDCRLPDALYGDAVRVRQVLINVLDNAVKYTDEGHVLLRMGGEVSGDCAFLRFSVEDTGRGIKEEDLAHLFEDFVQVDSTKNAGVVGTGLGLAIAHNIAHIMGGNIWVESEYGRGSTFHIEIPQGIRANRPVAAVKDVEEKRVALYTDDAVIRDCVRDALSQLGVAFTIVKSLTEFTDCLGQGYTHALTDEAVRMMPPESCTLAYISGNDLPVADGFRRLSLPIHSINLANWLNNVWLEQEEALPDAMFIAPRAHILIVDDNTTNLKVAVGLMASYKVQIDVCTSGREALRFVSNNRYDLIFMDHMMPEMDGVEVTHCIRALGEDDPYYESLPIIALTANAVSGMREMFLANGMNGFLSKPIEVSKLHQMLRTWLPESKIQPAVAVEAQSPEDIPDIRDVDVILGIERIGGSLEQYVDILRYYYEDGLKLLGTIESSLKEHDLALFTIYVHSLKSAAASIGALTLSEQAARLEAAGHAMDRHAINAEIDIFYVRLRTQLQEIGEYLKNQKEPAADATDDPSVLCAGLEKLLAAIDAYDMGAIDSVMRHLEGYAWPEDIAEQLHNLQRDFLLADMDRAARRAQRLLEQRQ